MHGNVSVNQSINRSKDWMTNQTYHKSINQSNQCHRTVRASTGIDRRKRWNINNIKTYNVHMPIKSDQDQAKLELCHTDWTAVKQNHCKDRKNVRLKKHLEYSTSPRWDCLWELLLRTLLRRKSQTFLSLPTTGSQISQKGPYRGLQERKKISGC